MAYLIIFLLMVLNGAFSMAEAALIASRKIRLERYAKHGNWRAKIALRLAHDPHRFLSTIQLGITLISIIAGAYGGIEISKQLANSLAQYPMLAEYAEAIGFVLIILFTTYLSIVIGELVPKTIAITRPEQIAMALAPLVQVLYYITLPFIWLLTISTKFILWLLRIKKRDDPPVTEEELKVIIEQGRQHGVLEQQESDMMRSIFRTADRNVSSLMTHRTDLVWIEIDAPSEDVLRIIQESNHTTFPVCNQSLDNVMGIISIKDVLVQISKEKKLNIRAILKQPMFVPESMPAMELLENFRESGKHASLVLNEYGSLEGIVTLHDVVETIFGDIPVTEHSKDEAIQRADGSWLMDGLMQTPRWSDLLGFHDLDLEDTGNYNTLGGFVLHQLGVIPKAGDKFDFYRFQFEVVDMDGMRVDKVLISKIPEQGE